MSFESKRQLRPPTQAPVRKLGGVGYELSRVQQNVEDATQKARALPHTKGRRITIPKQPSATYPLDISVSHGLGRKPIAAQVESRSDPCDEFFDFAGSNSRVLKVNVSALSELKVWVY